jgi:hypothetical protein
VVWQKSVVEKNKISEIFGVECAETAHATAVFNINGIAVSAVVSGLACIAAHIMSILEIWC